MKKLMAIVAVSAGLGFISGPAFAADPVAEACGISGVISAFGTLSSTDGSYNDGEGNSLGAIAKMNNCNVFGTGLNVQSDAYAEYADATDGDIDAYDSSSFGTVSHLYWRDSDRFAIGVLYGSGYIKESYSGEKNGINGVIGADAHLYLDNITLAAQGAYWNNFDMESSGAYVDIDNAWEVSLEGRYFATENLKLAARVSYDANETTTCECDWGAFRFGGGAEYKFDSVPLSLFASYTRVEGEIGTDFTSSDNEDSNIFKFGLSLHVNQNTLLAEDRYGASFSTPYVDPWTNISNAYYR